MSLDLATFDTKTKAEQGETLVLRHPETFEPMKEEDGAEIWIRLAGPESTYYQTASRASTNRRLQRRQFRATADELEHERIELLAACTLAWSGIVVHGERLGCSTETAKRLYREFRWLREQVDAFIEDRGNFFQIAANGLSPSGKPSSND
jgi:hypothetical protein